MAAISASKNMEETWFDGGYNSNKNIAFAHVEMGLMSHYHIDIDWRENVKYEHRFNGKTYFYSPEQEINYLYRKSWKDPKYEKDASLEYKMQFLIKGVKKVTNGFKGALVTTLIIYMVLAYNYI